MRRQAAEYLRLSHRDYAILSQEKERRVIERAGACADIIRHASAMPCYARG